MIDNEPVIYIRPTSANDTRTTDHMPSREELLKLSIDHIHEVNNGMNLIGKLIETAGSNHDFSKVTEAKQQWNDFKTVYDSDNNINFCDLYWCKYHNEVERHHLYDHVPDDVNLIDFLEMLVDGVMAGLGRSGSVYYEYLDELVMDTNLMKLMVHNTMKLLEDQTLFVDYDEDEDEEEDDSEEDEDEEDEEDDFGVEDDEQQKA